MATAKPFVIPALATLLIGLAPSAPARADAPQANCTPGKPALPDDLRAWTSPTHFEAAGTVSALDHAVLPPGQAALVALRPTPDVSYALRPDEPGGTVSSGGMVAFDAPKAGTYRVMLNARAWLDVVRDGTAIASTHHEHGPACSGIGKMVDFPLPAGRSVIQLSGSGQPEIEIMVMPVP
ncbi:hypothetical protein GLI01_34490 [Gluconacetobacter liquefaciens]|uniref:Homogentisate 1,2-dioxygenase n=1 Tax=Gluconacetobacter liquefaciens TaxID=89584 RepID=A0A370GC60_GLULI|nr:hypothetical protein [Gluconacetobacter liquefaciens]MBB2185356.1 hypothetical protein [Gluconacetobacter liquefaciens]RDI40800.1 hypothetical protein C7453_101599 [Gluconacetobacter liquefaciens]GBR07317.1 hypothetical protein AA0522_2165 [Gluconacetobacter liquefaciens NRIC 0522]GEB39414.1 hypothetical protein GLI01_34490 [Gluconacetobacter liquefaciens]